MECHPKAPELQKAAKDLVDQMSQSCGSTDSRCYEQILGREVKEEYTRTSEKLKCKWNVMELGRLNDQFPRNRVQQLVWIDS